MQKIKTTRIFKWLNETTYRINLLVGGAGSSKSYSIAQYIIKRFYEDDNTRILVVRKTTPSLRISAYHLVLSLLKDYGWPYGLNKTEMVLTYGDNEILFKGLDDPEKIKSAEFNIVWVEEATEITLEDYRQLNLRLRRKGVTNQMFMSCNPVSALHWIKTELADKADIGIHHSTYKDNPFIDEVYKQQLEDLINQDENFYKIYALGQWGVLENIIYSGWKIVKEPEKFDDITFGVDWGYNSPSCLCQIFWQDGRFTAKELIYSGGLTQQVFVDKIKDVIPAELKRKNIYVDSSEPALIQALYNEGFNAHPAKKDVTDGISYVKTHFIGVTPGSANAIKELNSYSWKRDKADNIIDEPVKFNDHFCDAMRYGSYSNYRQYAKGKTLAIAFR